MHEQLKALYTSSWAIWRYSGARDSAEITLGTLRQQRPDTEAAGLLPDI
jgi:hypothetical protein